MNKIKKVTIMGLVILFLSIFFPLKSNAAGLSREELWSKKAAAIGENVNVGGSSYDGCPFHLRNYGTYCIHHKGSFERGEYKVKEYVKIEGRLGRSFKKDGTVISSNSYQANAILAYLLERSSWAKAGFIANYNDNGVYNTLNSTEKNLLNILSKSSKTTSIRRISMHMYIRYLRKNIPGMMNMLKSFARIC